MQKWKEHSDLLGFGQNKNFAGFKGSVILATDLSKKHRQSLVFAFAQDTGEIALGYFLHAYTGYNDTLSKVTKNPKIIQLLNQFSR